MINNVSKINHDEKSSFSYSEPRSCQIENSDHVTNLAIISTWDHTLFRTIVSEFYCIVMIFKKNSEHKYENCIPFRSYIFRPVIECMGMARGLRKFEVSIIGSVI